MQGEHALTQSCRNLIQEIEEKKSRSETKNFCSASCGQHAQIDNIPPAKNKSQRQNSQKCKVNLHAPDSVEYFSHTIGKKSQVSTSRKRKVQAEHALTQFCRNSIQEIEKKSMSETENISSAS